MQAVTDETFDDTVVNSARPTLVDFWAPWCTTCLRLMPSIEALDSAGTHSVVSVNVEQNPATAARFSVLSLPTFIVFRDGEPIARASGRVTVEDVRRLLD